MHRLYINISLSVLLLSSILWVSCEDEGESVSRNSAIPVKIAQVEERHLALPIRTSGLLSTPAEMKLSFKIGGIIDKISVDEGESSQAGQLLAILEQSEIKARLKQAQNAYQKVKRDFERVKALYQDSVVTLEQRQDLETALAVAQADLEIAEFNFRYSRITAPTNGKILKIFAEENELVEQGTPILIYGALHQHWIIRTAVIDRDVVRIQLGDSAKASFNAFPDQFFRAHISEISESASPVTGLYEVELTLEDLQQKLISGFVGQIEIYPSQTQKVFIVPIEALVEADAKRGTVFIASLTDSTAARKAVEIGNIFENKLSVTSDLSGMEWVVTEGAPYLNDGAKISINN